MRSRSSTPDPLSPERPLPTSPPVPRSTISPSPHRSNPASPTSYHHPHHLAAHHSRPQRPDYISVMSNSNSVPLQQLSNNVTLQQLSNTVPLQQLSNSAQQLNNSIQQQQQLSNSIPYTQQQQQLYYTTCQNSEPLNHVIAGSSTIRYGPADGIQELAASPQHGQYSWRDTVVQQATTAQQQHAATVQQHPALHGTGVNGASVVPTSQYCGGSGAGGPSHQYRSHPSSPTQPCHYYYTGQPAVVPPCTAHYYTTTQHQPPSVQQQHGMQQHVIQQHSAQLSLQQQQLAMQQQHGMQQQQLGMQHSMPPPSTMGGRRNSGPLYVSVSSPQVRRKLYGAGSHPNSITASTTAGGYASTTAGGYASTTVGGYESATVGGYTSTTVGGYAGGAGYTTGLITPPTPSSGSASKRPVTLLRSLDSSTGAAEHHQQMKMTTSVSGGDVTACYDSTANYEISV